MSDNEENEQIPENTSDDLGENQEVENEEVQKDEIPKTGRKKPAMNKDGTPRKTLTEEQQKARLEVLRKGREKANIKRKILKEEAMKSKPEYHPPATQNQPEPETVKVVKSKPKPKKKTIVIEESESEESEEEIVVKRVRKPKAKQQEQLPMNPPPPRMESEAEKKQKLKQMKDDLVNKKVYKSLFD